jgi:hypothetical protein
MVDRALCFINGRKRVNGELARGWSVEQNEFVRLSPVKCELGRRSVEYLNSAEAIDDDLN